MKLSKTLVISIFGAATLAASSLLVSAQTPTRRQPAAKPARAAEKPEAKEEKEAEESEEPAEAADQSVERTIATEANVAVRVCVASGSITVHGWDRKEVRARSTDVAEIEFQHEGEPARKIQLLIADKAQGPGRTTSCLSFSDVEMDVPRGATVQLQTRDGDIRVVDVATAYVNTQSGDVSVEHASKAVDVGTVGGEISLRESSGGVNLHSVGGSIEASGVRPTEASDIFDASSVGGDIVLEQVTHARLNARSLNGSLSMVGALAHEGHYGFKTISGDVTLTLPGNSSFKISARLSRSAEMVTDFPLTLMSYSTASPSPLPKLDAMPTPDAASPADAAALPETTPRPDAMPRSKVTPPAAPTTPVIIVSPAPPAEPQADPAKAPKVKGPKTPRVVIEGYPLRRLDGICGSGDAVIEVGSFSGTVHLKKQ